MKKISWKNTRATEMHQVYCSLEFDFYGSEEDYNQLVFHYNHLAQMYRLEMLLFHQYQHDSDTGYSPFRLFVRKTEHSLCVSPKMILDLIETDARILQRIFRLGEMILRDQPNA